MSIMNAAILAKVTKIETAVGGGNGGGVDTSDATATADDILAGETAYGADGTKMVGTIATEELPQPTISVDSSGKITASVTLNKNAYHKAKTQTATKTLTTQSAKTITPSTSQQTAVASGRYTTGNVLVAGDADLKSENIKKGVTIFNVEGTYERPNEPDLTPENIRSGVDIYGVVGTLVAGEKALYGNWEITYPDAMGYMLQNNMYEGKPSSVSQDINFTVMTDGGVEESFSGMTIGYVLEFDSGPDNDATWEGFRITYKTSLGTEIVVWEQNYYGETTYPSSLGENFKNVSFGKEAQCVSQTFFDVFAYYESGYDEWGGGEYEEYHCKFLGCGECEVPDIALSISGNYVLAEANGERVAEYNVVQAEPDIKPANIKKGVKIFSVTGSYEPDVELSVDGDTVIATSDDETIAEYQLPSLAAKTYTPGATAVKISKEQWLTGDQTIAGDSDLKAENIKKGVTIFNVTGTYEGASGGSAGTATILPTPSFDSVPIIYYDQVTAEKVTKYLLGDEPNNTTTVPCGVPVFMYQDLDEGYDWTGAITALVTSIDEEEMRIPISAYPVVHCSECTSEWRSASAVAQRIWEHCPDNEYATDTDHPLKFYLIGTFVIPKEYAGCKFDFM